MKKIKGVKRDNGFTLMEVIIVITLLGMIVGLTTFVGFDSYRGSSFRSERDALIGVMQRARSMATNNICLGGCTNGKHGVHITATEFTIFQGSDYLTRDSSYDEITKMGPLVQIAPGSFTDVIFSGLSGDATTLPSGVSTLTMTDATGHNSVITIQSFGQITWTN